MEKVMRVGTVQLSHRKTPCSVFVKADIASGKLSISGVIGPLANGDAVGGCGQIDMEFAHRNPADNDARYSSPLRLVEFAAGWNEELWLEFLDVWARWHMNDARAGCEHQIAEGWDKRPIDPAKPLTAYGKHFEGQQSSTWNMLAWVTRQEHQEGLLSHPCPVCGYRYGSAWRKEELPQRVVQFIGGLPDTDRQPAWV